MINSHRFVVDLILEKMGIPKRSFTKDEERYGKKQEVSNYILKDYELGEILIYCYNQGYNESKVRNLFGVKPPNEEEIKKSLTNDYPNE